MAQIFWDFAQIFAKSKLFGVRWQTQLLHHWVTMPKATFWNQRMQNV